MTEKIFISYNHKDQRLIDTVTRRLVLEFGKNNIFYDAWSIQPGDSIIGKMNEGLDAFTTFFFFVSNNSLESKMVALEWQTALNKSINKDLKFVAIRIDDCSIPAILLDKLYIDLYGEGLDSTVEKMRCIIRSENCYKPLDNIENLEATYEIIDSKKVKITIKAIAYSENSPTFAFACQNSFDEFSACFTISEGLALTNRVKITTEKGLVLNAYTARIQRTLQPGFPFVFEVVAKQNLHALKNITIYILKNAEKGLFESIPIK